MMKSGRELDELVAEKVMGWENVRKYCEGNTSYCALEFPYLALIGDFEGETQMIPEFSTSITAAWNVWLKIARTNQILMRSHNEGVCIRIDEKSICEWGEAPHAICLCALKAVGVDNVAV
jgi:hypothetical protein